MDKEGHISSATVYRSCAGRRALVRGATDAGDAARAWAQLGVDRRRRILRMQACDHLAIAGLSAVADRCSDHDTPPRVRRDMATSGQAGLTLQAIGTPIR